MRPEVAAAVKTSPAPVPLAAVKKTHPKPSANSTNTAGSANAASAVPKQSPTAAAAASLGVVVPTVNATQSSNHNLANSSADGAEGPATDQPSSGDCYFAIGLKTGCTVSSVDLIRCA